jgi:thioredoxin-related protein
MSVICQCPSCKAKYQVGDQYAGHKIKCPKCSAAVNVPAAAQTPSPVAPIVAADSEDADEEMAFAQGGDDNLDFLKGESGSRINYGERSGKQRVSGNDSSVLSGELGKSGIGSRSSVIGRGHHPMRKKKSGSGLLIAGIVGVCLAIVGVVGGVIFVQWQAKAGGSTTVSNDKKPDKPAVDPSVPMINFTFKWPENERSGATLMVNGELTAVPASGEFKIKLPKVSQAYHFVLERKGYSKQEFSRPLTEDDDYTVKWESNNHGVDDWEQDFDAAKKAAGQSKNVLIVFDASDAKASQYHSSRFNESVAMSPEFVERASKDYVCVYIDNPEKDEAKKKVRDLNRNRELTRKFRISVFPTAVVTDSSARPYGILEDYTINGVTSFLALMDKWQSDQKILFAMLDKIKAGGDKPDTTLLKQAISFLELNKLDGIYAHTIQGWTDKLPKGEAEEVTEQEYKSWVLRFARAHENPDNAKREVEEFDHWKAKHTFKKHADIGATLNAFAGALLAQIGDKDAAKKKCDEAKAFPTKNAHVKKMIADVMRAVTGKPGEEVALPRGSGSGYCIAQGNYVMTNHHVIADAKKIMIHLNGDEERYLAHLIADNPEGDMAVLKIDLPADKALVPVPFVAKDMEIGEEVCAFGWPGLLSENATSTLTNGLISNIDSTDGSLVTNCKVDHGNSGGPLCSVSGCAIAGMVSRGTAVVGELHESYGLAIPASQLKAFLKEKLPRDVLAKIPRQTSATGGKLPEAVKKITPSVVYVENYQ